MIERIMRFVSALLLAWFGLAAMFEPTYRAELADAFTIFHSGALWSVVGAACVATAAALFVPRARRTATWSLCSFAVGLVVLIVGFGDGGDPYVVLLLAPLALMALTSVVGLASMRAAESAPDRRLGLGSDVSHLTR